MHSAQSTIIGLCQQVARRYPVAGQKRACEASGATRLIEVSKSGPHSLAGLVQGARPEVGYVCEWLWLLAPTRGTVIARRAALLRFEGEITARGSFIVEAGSKRSTADPKQRSIMLAEATVGITNWRQPNDKRKPGRRAKGKAGDDDLARAAWFDMRYATNDEAERHFPPKWGGQEKAYRLFKASGRGKVRRK